MPSYYNAFKFNIRTTKIGEISCNYWISARGDAATMLQLAMQEIEMEQGVGGVAGASGYEVWRGALQSLPGSARVQ
jgi:hypothetical protein